MSVGDNKAGKLVIEATADFTDLNNSLDALIAKMQSATAEATKLGDALARISRMQLAVGERVDVSGGGRGGGGGAPSA